MVDSIRPAPLAPPKPQVDEAEGEAKVAAVDAETPAAAPQKPLDLTYRGAGWSPAAAANAQLAEKKKEEPSLAVDLTGALVVGVLGGIAVDMVANRPSNPGQRIASNLAGTFKPWQADFSGYGLGTKTGAAHNALHAMPGMAAYLAGRARGHSKFESSLMAGAMGVGIEIGEAGKDLGDVARTMAYGTAGGMVAEELIGYAIKDSVRFGGDGNPVQRLLRGITSVGIGPNKSFSVTASYDF